jgi:hypothetical protein
MGITTFNPTIAIDLINSMRTEKQQDDAFFYVRKFFNHDSGETWNEYPMWRTKQDLVEYLRKSCIENSLSSGANWVLMKYILYLRDIDKENQCLD